jgi:hypothetical protein
MNHLDYVQNFAKSAVSQTHGTGRTNTCPGKKEIVPEVKPL